jgi:hypothetical protein
MTKIEGLIFLSLKLNGPLDAHRMAVMHARTATGYTN